MEEYVNNKTLVEEEISLAFKPLSICPLCESILIKPLMCMKCQKAFCKKCIDKYKENNSKCPNGCNSPDFQNCIGKNEILSKLKFKCLECGEKIPYDEAEKHHNYDCKGKKVSNEDVKKSNAMAGNIPVVKIKRLTPEEVEKLKKKGIDLNYITSIYLY
jgi:hypothetical protein